MPVIVATKTLRYGRKDQQPGDSFEASEKDAKLLCQIGKARLSNALPPKSVDLPKEVMGRAPTEAPIKYVPVDPQKSLMDDTHQPEAPALKRHYRRRDMSADQD